MLILRRALAELQATINANGMHKTHREWGGSHDVILGFMLWLHDIPLYPIASGYRSDRMKKGSLDKLENEYSDVLDNAIIVHDVNHAACVDTSIFKHLYF